MPFFWIKDKGNFVAIKFTKPSIERIEETFASPASADNLDTELLAYFKSTVVGDAIEINLKDSGLKTERSLKVRVGKHAKLANRELEYRTASDGNFLFRVSSILEAKTETATNGTNGSATESASEETTARSRR